MSTIKETARTITNKVQANKHIHKHSNLIICGENSDGKSTLIKLTVSSCKSGTIPIYYIGSQNRLICDYDNTAAKALSLMHLENIVDSRLDLTNYLRKDVFEKRDYGPAVAYNAIENDIDKYNDLFWDFFGISVEMAKPEKSIQSVPNVIVNGMTEIYNVSSSQAAKMRLLLEIDFAITKGAKIIFIDEFDEFMTDKTASTFLLKLHEEYPETMFIVSVQSVSVILQINDFDIAIIRNTEGNSVLDNTVHFYDSDSIIEVGQIEKIKDLIGCVRKENSLEEIVSRYVDTGEITEDDKNVIESVVRKSLSGREKILLDYLKKAVNL